MHIATLKAFSLLARMAWRLKNTHIAAVEKGLATCTHGLATERYTHAHRNAEGILATRTHGLASERYTHYAAKGILATRTHGLATERAT